MAEAPGHEVLVLDSAPQLAEIGVGLQLTPNSTRLLERWGVDRRLEKQVPKPQVFTIHRYSDGKILGERRGYGDEMLRKYHANFWDIHRADLQHALSAHAQELGVKFRFNVIVEKHDLRTAEVTTSTGETFQGDLLVAADGLWSKTRSSFLGKDSPPLPTGDLAYRILLQTKDFEDGELQKFASIPRVSMWVGPDCHVLCYPMKNDTMLNIALLVPDNLPEAVAKVPGDLAEMHEIFRHWDSLLKKMLSLVNKVDKWKLMHLDELDRWYNDEGNVVLLGDACHPMLPCMAQGAGSALEDGAALGILVADFTSKKDLPAILQRYQELRKVRSLALQKGSMKQRHNHHLPDGPEQAKRDELCLSQIDEPQPGYPFYWIDPEMQSYVYAYDVFEAVVRRQAE